MERYSRCPICQEAWFAVISGSGATVPPLQLHHLSELADVIDPAGNSGVVIINIHAGRNKVSACIVDLHLAAVRDAEQLVVVAGDKTDAVIVRHPPDALFDRRVWLS